MNFGIAVAAIAALTLGTFAAQAQETPTTPAEPVGTLAFQLNKAETIEGNCNLTFVVQNNTGTVIEKSNFDLAIVDTDGAVSQLIKIEFRPLRLGTPRAQSFTLRGTTCETISAISINDFNECTASTGEASSLCEDAVVASSRSGLTIEFPWTL